MHEDIRAAVFRCEEPEALGVVEPLHCAVLHDSFHLVWMRLRVARVQGARTHGPSMQSNPADFNHPAASAETSPGSPDDAASTLATTSSSVICSSCTGPAPAAQLATMARHA